MTEYRRDRVVAKIKQHGRLLAVMMLVSFSSVAAARTPITLELIISPTSYESVLQQQAVEQLQNKYGEQLKVRTYYHVATVEGVAGSPRGAADYQEAKRLRLIKNHFPGKLAAYRQARQSELYSPIWEHAAGYAQLDPIKIVELMNQSRDKVLWQDDVAIIHQYQIRQTPALILDGQLWSTGSIGLALLDAELQQRLAPSQAPIDLRILVDPQTAQPITRHYRQHLRKYIKYARVEIITITPEIEARLLDQGIHALPIVLVNETFLSSFYLNHIPDDQTIDLGDMGSYLPILNEKDTLLVPPRGDKKIDVYIQAHCPYAVKLVLQLAKTDKARLNFPSFIIDYDEQSQHYTSYHGQAELEETIRQLVMQKNYPDQYCFYFKARYSEPKANWQTSLKQAGIDREILEKQISEQGQQLLAAHYQQNKTIPLPQSPTVVIDGRYLLHDIGRYFEKQQITLNGTCGQ